MIISLSNPMIEFPDTSDKAQFEMNVPKRNQQLLNYQHENGKTANVLGYDMLLAPAGAKNSLTLEKEGKIIYWVFYGIYKHLYHKEVVQYVVWSDETRTEMRGFARKVMLDHFLQHYDAISTSEIQFPYGKAMWKKLIRDLIGTYFVYLIEQSAVVMRIPDYATLEKMSDQIWGDQLWHKSIRLAISKIELPIEIED